MLKGRTTLPEHCDWQTDWFGEQKLPRCRNVGLQWCISAADVTAEIDRVMTLSTPVSRLVAASGKRKWTGAGIKPVDVLSRGFMRGVARSEALA